MTDRYGVMGQPVSHSKSPYIHTRFAAQTGESLAYEAIAVEPGEFPKALKTFRERGGQGLNITLPFKQEAFELAAVCTRRAERAGAVNTLWFDQDTGVCGDNTDGVGLIRDLANSCALTVASRSVLLVGAGGAARGAACALLDEEPANLVVANRTHDKALALVREIGETPRFSAVRLEELEGECFELVVNATAASLEGKTPLISPSVITLQSICYDMMYGPGDTAFVRWGRAHGARDSVDGLGMLVEQAAESFFLWRGVRPDTRVVLQDLREELATKNPTGIGR